MSSTVHLRSASLHVPDTVSYTIPFACTFSTMPFEHSTFRWFSNCDCTPLLMGLPSSLIQHCKELSTLFTFGTHPGGKIPIADKAHKSATQVKLNSSNSAGYLNFNFININHVCEYTPRQQDKKTTAGNISLRLVYYK